MQTENDHVCFSLCGNHVLPVYCVSSSFVPCPEARFVLPKQNVAASPTGTRDTSTSTENKLDDAINWLDDEINVSGTTRMLSPK
jgi:hypothetical protein